MVKIAGFRIKLNIEINSPLKLTKVGFILFGFNSASPASRAEELATVNHVTHAVGGLGLRLSFKPGLKEYYDSLQIFKNRGLGKNS